MLKLVRVALTAAILVALGVRLRRRARRPSPVPPSPAPRPVEVRGKTGMWLAWVVIAAVVAVVLAVALIPAQGRNRAEGTDQEQPGQTLTLNSHGQVLSAETPDGADATPPPAVATPSTAAATPSSAAVTPSPAEATPQVLAGPVTCTPVRRPVAIRPIDTSVKRQVIKEWRRIERWLRANAPTTYRTLGAPGRARTIAVAESQMGLDFPDDLRASLLRHNGGNDVLPGGLDLTIRQIRDTWRGQCRVDGEWWQAPRMIPFQSRWSGRWAVVDAASHNVSWDDDVADFGLDAAPTPVTFLLRTTADVLERGGDVAGWTPKVKRGVLQWKLEYLEN
ncbi:SMI1/KNR4 family protein [Nonomuraea endophytica]|uniref:Cell wall assembly regulator SMI1 n=1 Tax=Nonomuraea endophytica TaxID=714136 RepID=A0A7W8ABF6_9ACTN|nr:SMI1/KNR4 family protein [Nonomuraea endophytica]MBB5082534.1 cell wall assembly regulator SMI1 [Nonomuraea endophytica]